MTREQGKVKEFMQTFGQATPTNPTVPDAKTRILRVKLLLEEVLELAEASGIKITSEVPKGEELTGGNLYMSEKGETDLVGVADALADIDYVMQGAAVAYGLDLEPFCDEVHSSNMTKLWKESELPEAKVRGYSITPTPKGYLVKNLDGKVMKSPSYRAAQLAPILGEQKNWTTIENGKVITNGVVVGAQG